MDGVKPLRAFLKKITVHQLQAKCVQLKFPYEGMLKAEIQTKLFKVILKGHRPRLKSIPLHLRMNQIVKTRNPSQRICVGIGETG